MPLIDPVSFGYCRKVIALILVWGVMLAVSPPTDGDISGATLDGRIFSSKKEQGRVLLVNFWATWCAPCQRELPALDAFYRGHHIDGFDMIAISLDKGISRQALAKATNRFSFPVARITDIKVAPRSIPTSLPVMWVYARDGSIPYDSAKAARNGVDVDTLNAIVKPLLDKSRRVR